MDNNCDPEGRNIDRMVRKMAEMQKAGMADIFISNPGQMTLPEVPGLTDAYACYPGGYMPTTCFATSTFRGRMTITMGYQDSDRAREGTRKAMYSLPGTSPVPCRRRMSHISLVRNQKKANPCLIPV